MVGNRMSLVVPMIVPYISENMDYVYYLLMLLTKIVILDKKTHGAYEELRRFGKNTLHNQPQ